ncbi:hypothetical protein [Bifidobacterium sp.]|jgi:hypothetical protein|uniref:hypothetical protein n=1 Tax=Bifidobacterium sp. TaxID=41200 RepID=UPI0025BB43DB|nr:hypothetical protein [Bifidobacterium sp.]MCH4209556.1 hypothetical protein [Bifidobacterium sp.]
MSWPPETGGKQQDCQSVVLVIDDFGYWLDDESEFARVRGSEPVFTLDEIAELSAAIVEVPPRLPALDEYESERLNGATGGTRLRPVSCSDAFRIDSGLVELRCL